MSSRKASGACALVLVVSASFTVSASATWHASPGGVLDSAMIADDGTILAIAPRDTGLGTTACPPGGDFAAVRPFRGPGGGVQEGDQSVIVPFPGGGGLVVWRALDLSDQNDDTPTFSEWLATARVAADGTFSAATNLTPVETVPAPAEQPYGGGRPAVAVDPAGDALLMWTPHATTSSAVVQTVTRSSVGAVGPVVTVSGTGVLGARLASSNSGEVVAVWERNGAVEASFGTTASGLGTVATISSTGVGSRVPRVAMASDGTAIAVWQAPGSARAVEYAVRPPGGSFGPVEQLGAGDVPTIAFDGAGAAIVAWRGSDGNGHYPVTVGVRPANGVFGAAETLSDPLSNAVPGFPVVGSTPSGSVIVGWGGDSAAPWRVQERPSGGSFGPAEEIGVNVPSNTDAPWFATGTAQRVIVWGPTMQELAGVMAPARFYAQRGFSRACAAPPQVVDNEPHAPPAVTGPAPTTPAESPSPAEIRRALANEALRGPTLRLSSLVLGPAFVFVRASGGQARVIASRGARVLRPFAIVCTAACTVTGGSVLRAAGKAARTAAVGIRLKHLRLVVPAGQVRRIAMPLPSAARRLLRRAGRVELLARFTVRAAKHAPYRDSVRLLAKVVGSDRRR